jgi:hypothetical protein
VKTTGHAARVNLLFSLIQADDFPVATSGHSLQRLPRDNRDRYDFFGRWLWIFHAYCSMPKTDGKLGRARII